MICNSKKELLNMGDGHMNEAKHNFCEECITKYNEQATGGMIVEEKEGKSLIECPVRNCDKKIDLTEIAAEFYGENFEKYVKTATMKEDPFIKKASVIIDKKKIKGKCFSCDVNKGYAEKSKDCSVFCQFFSCKTHIKEACAKIAECENHCPWKPCNAVYPEDLITRYSDGSVKVDESALMLYENK